MSKRRHVLHQFESILPRSEISQQRSLDWLAWAHSQTGPESTHARLELMKKHLNRFGCSPSQVSCRYSTLSDFNHQQPEKMQIFDLSRNPRGSGTLERTQYYAKVTDEIFEQFYVDENTQPRGLLHVTCTGYASPSAAERLVSRKQWGKQTAVYHVYHMGCYAAIPAIQIATGLTRRGSNGGNIDIVHTELCSLHLDTSTHTPEQLVIQSLFSDGMIRYSVSEQEHFTTRQRAQRSMSGLEILSVRKEIISDSQDAMTWITGNHGMQMTLARDVPERISNELPGFLERLIDDAAIDKSEITPASIFAIHPGGPRIIDQIQTLLGLEDSQVKASRAVLYQRGNMSSATLPHIWMQILQDEDTPDKSLIVSLAFGPGLTLSGAILKKLCR